MPTRWWKPLQAAAVIDREVIAAVQIAHIADRRDPLRGQEFAQLQKIFRLLFDRIYWKQGSQQIPGVFLQDAVGSPFSSRSISPPGGSGVFRSIPRASAHAVDAADVGAGPHHGNRGVAASPVQIVAGGRALFQQPLLVIAPSFDPFSGFLLFSALSDRFDKVFYRIDLGRHCVIFLRKSASMTGCI